MKTRFNNEFLLPALITALSLLLAGRAIAQTYNILYTFSNTTNFNYGASYTNTDGSQPSAALVLSGNTLYGTAVLGGTNGNGTVFAVRTDGTGFTDLYSFATFYPLSYYKSYSVNSDGANPVAGLILSGNTLYGTTSTCSSNASGSVFAINTDGTGFRTLHSFTGVNYNSVTGDYTNSDGDHPSAALILLGNTLYGTTSMGGSGGGGTIFAVNTDGTRFTNLHSFGSSSFNGGLNNNLNSDGASPYGGLLLSGYTLYGTASGGGTNGNGTVFAINTDGTGFTNLHNFADGDGGFPECSLILSGNTFYGTTALFGILNNYLEDGTVFAVNTNGTGFTVLHVFTDGADGGSPHAGLLLSGNILYGTARYGGANDNGTLFAVKTDGTCFTNLYSFTARSGSYPFTNSDGALPVAGLVLSGNTLYGTATYGGPGGNGAVFSLSLGPYFIDYSASPSAGPVPLTVHFTSASVDFGGNTIIEWNWDFGDGSPHSTLQNPSHTYTDVGIYSPSLVATNNLGVTVIGSGPSITASLPTVQYTANPTNGLVPLTAQFTSPGVDSGGNAISRWNWIFGDGSTSTAQNPSHVYTMTGTFLPSLIATNNLGVTVIGSGPSINAQFNSGLVVNGGFETGNYSFWTLSGDTSPWTIVDNGWESSGIQPHSGAYIAELRTTSARGFLSQTLSTVARQTYLLSFWLDSPDGYTPNEFLVSWNENTLFDQGNLPAIGWTNLQFMVMATGTNTVLQFGFQDVPSYFGLDDISVVSLSTSPTPVILSTPQITSGKTNFTFLLSGPAGSNYVLQVSTNLLNWNPVNTSAIPISGSINVTNATGGYKSRFYRIYLQ